LGPKKTVSNRSTPDSGTAKVNAGILIGLAGGLAAALMFAAASGGLIILFPFAVLAQLPIAIASLGWGSMSGWIAASCATLAVGIGLGPLAALGFLFSAALPAAWLSHLLGLARHGSQGDAQWYPIGRIVLHGVLMIAVVTIIGGLLLGYDSQSLVDTIAQLTKSLFDPNDPLAPDDTVLALNAAAFVRWVPYVIPAVWSVIALFNLWLAARIVRTSGRLTRPWEDLAALSLPTSATYIFAAAVVGSFIAGELALIASAFAGAMGVAFLLVGLGVLHTITRGSPLRTMVLSVTYVSIVLVSLPAIPIGALGVAEGFLKLRARAASRRPPSSPPPASPPAKT
jgi:hypothetical protein